MSLPVSLMASRGLPQTAAEFHNPRTRYPVNLLILVEGHERRSPLALDDGKDDIGGRVAK